MNEKIITEQSNDRVLIMSFLIGIPSLFLFFVYEIPFLQAIDENIASILGMISVIVILFIPPKIADYIEYGKSTQQSFTNVEVEK